MRKFVDINTSVMYTSLIYTSLLNVSSIDMIFMIDACSSSLERCSNAHRMQAELEELRGTLSSETTRLKEEAFEQVSGVQQGDLPPLYHLCRHCCCRCSRHCCSRCCVSASGQALQNCCFPAARQVFVCLPTSGRVCGVCASKRAQL